MLMDTKAVGTDFKENASIRIGTPKEKTIHWDHRIGNPNFIYLGMLLTAMRVSAKIHSLALLGSSTYKRLVK